MPQREPLTLEQINRLADDVKAKLLSNSDLLKRSEGEIQVRIFRQDAGFDIKFNMTVR